MNSWKSSGFGAGAPPLRTLKFGIGIRAGAPKPGSHACNGCPCDAARARATAIDVPTIAFAPQPGLVRGAIGVRHRRIDLGNGLP